MIDLWIDRLNDHCRYGNERHSWLLPRRLRLDRAFKLERQKERSLEYELNIMRVLRVGCLALPQNLEQGGASITVPDDMDAFALGLCADIEWRPFERSRQGAPVGRKRYRYAELSDKGRYQLGVIDRFASVTEAFDVLMNGYWRDVLLSLGAVPAEKNAGLRDQLNHETAPTPGTAARCSQLQHARGCRKARARGNPDRAPAATRSALCRV